MWGKITALSEAILGQFTKCAALLFALSVASCDKPSESQRSNPDPLEGKTELELALRGMGGVLDKVDDKAGTFRVILRGGDVGSGRFNVIARFQNVVELTLGGSNIRDEDMVEVARMKRLQVLDVSVSLLTPKGLTHLEELPALSELDLSHSQIHDSEFHFLSRFPVLRVLVLDRSQCTPKSLRQLENVRSLEEIYIHGEHEKLRVWTRVGGVKGFEGYWKPPKGLQMHSKDYQLALENTVNRLGGSVLTEDEEPNGSFVKITDPRFESKRLEELVRFQNIVTLSLTNTKVDDTAMASVAKLKNLKSLHLSGTQVTFKGISQLGGLQALTFLDLTDVQIHGSDFACLDVLGSLKVLFLDKTQVTTKALKHFDRHRSLEDINMIDEKAKIAPNVWSRGLGTKGSEHYWKSD